MKEIGIYVAGPLFTSGDLTTNTRNAIDAAQKLETAQVEGVIFRPFIPHILVQTWQLVYPRGHALAQEYDDYWLKKCDAMLRLPGRSVGSDHEEVIAVTHGIPLFFTVEAVCKWAQLHVGLEALRRLAST